MLKVEQDDISASEVSQAYHRIDYKLKEVKIHIFAPIGDRKLLIKLKSEGVVNEDKFFESVLEFYEVGIKYLKLPESSFNNTHISIVDLEVTWSELEVCAMAVKV